MRGQMFWWIFGYVNGVLICDGGHASEAKAYEKGFSINDWDSDFSVKSYRTRDMRVAKSIWKSEQAGLTGSMSQSLHPIRSIKTDKKTRLDELKEARGL